MGTFYDLIPSQKLTEEGNKIHILFCGIADITRSISVNDVPNVYHGNDIDDDYCVDESDMYEKKLAEFVGQIPEDHFAVRSAGKGDTPFKLYNKDSVIDYIHDVLTPNVEMTESFKTHMGTILDKYNGIYDAVARISKKTGIDSGKFHLNAVINTGIRNLVNEVFTKFCKENRESLKIKNRIAIISDPSVAQAFCRCSYLADKGADLVLYKNTENLYVVNRTFTSKDMESGMFYNGTCRGFIAGFILALIQEGIGLVRDSESGRYMNLSYDPSRYCVTEDDIEDVLKIARKVDNGTFKYVLYPAENGFSVNKDGSFSINIDLCIYPKEKLKNEE